MDQKMFSIHGSVDVCDIGEAKPCGITVGYQKWENQKKMVINANNIGTLQYNLTKKYEIQFAVVWCLAHSNIDFHARYSR